MAETAEKSEKKTEKESTSSTSEEGLLLYHEWYSFYSQKVVFALYEKKLNYRSYYVNLLNAEHLEPWFVKLNPEGKIPVLKDGVKVIPDSARIIDYLEDNFSNGDTPRLKPEKGSAAYKKMEHFVQLFDTIKVPVVTFGCILHPELAQNMKMSSAERTIRSGVFPSLMVKVDEMTEKNKEYKDFYKSKKATYTEMESTIKDIDKVKKAISDLGTVFEEVEKELETHDGDKEKWWLCGEKFTIVDINLAVILKRIVNIGLWNQYFGDSKLPKLNNYYKRVQLRDAFKKTMNQNASIIRRICCLGTKEKLAVSLSSALIVLGVAGLAVFIAQRRK